MDITLNSIGRYVRNNCTLPLIISIIFVLLTFMSIICAIMALHIPTPTSPQILVTHQANSNPIAPNLSDFHLFGQYQSQNSLLPQTTLQLTLQGIALALSPKQTSRAIISANGVTKIYQTGQIVPGGATIKAINRNAVILLQNNILQRLKLPIPKLANHGLYLSEKK